MSHLKHVTDVMVVTTQVLYHVLKVSEASWSWLKCFSIMSLKCHMLDGRDYTSVISHLKQITDFKVATAQILL